MASFPFPALCILLQKRILDVGDEHLRLNLALSARRMEALVRVAKTKSPAMRFSVEKGVYRVSMGEWESPNVLLALTVKPEKTDMEVNGIYPSERLSEFEDYIDVVCGKTLPAPLKSSCAFMVWLEKLLLPRKHGWTFDDMKAEECKSLIALPLFKDSFAVEITGGELDSEALTLLIDRLERAEKLTVNCSLPLDFDHPNPFRVPNMEFREARWVRLEHLLSLKTEKLTLGETNIDSHDLNRYLKAWMENVSLPDTRLAISNLKTDIDFKVVFEGIRPLTFLHGGHRACAIMARSEENCAGQIGCIGSDAFRTFEFVTFPEEKLPGKKTLLRLLHQKADLEEEEEAVSEEILKLEDVSFEWDTAEDREQLRKISELNAGRQKIRKELSAVRWQLEIKNVVFSSLGACVP